LARYAEAIAAFRKAEEMTGGSPEPAAFIGYAHGMAGQRQEACEVLRQLHQIGTERYVQPAFFGIVHVGLREFDQAFDYFEKAIEERSSQLALMRLVPKLKPIVNDPRYAKLLARLGLPLLPSVRNASGGYSD